jgi:hypothetical protein
MSMVSESPHRPTDGRSHTHVQRLLVAMSLVMASLGLTTATAAPASATEVWMSGGTVIIRVVTGDKNYGNHTQWVSSITILSSTAQRNAYGCGTFEAWTQSYYASTPSWAYCGGVTFYISRWVSSGNGVCGAFTDKYHWWARSVACITIRV